ncbi:DNA cytosine methyltransferase [Planobispora siamensis]|uniref:DNA (cytosine-5-)-methyltransferase n=1 Tax=Planobispora siamensis TaxID=936338 RepID=A0A8J3WN32_9ACTN|nr:DNA cytosine methyltransferase [Planobispora siamensis]GIH95330.1 hypothetical protein Psi01_59600 [Planobispora siamensis]
MAERMVLDLFAGPGGWDMGGRILRMPELHGYDIDADACTTARAAGFLRTQADVRAMDPDDFPDTLMCIISSPCPTFSRGGLLTGVSGDEPELLRKSIERMGDGYLGRCDEDAWQEIHHQVRDIRTALVLQALRWALCLPNARWIIAEQVPGARPIWMEMAAELASVTGDWRSCHVVTVHGDDLGLPSRRSRTFLIATRSHAPDLVDDLPMRAHWSCGRIDPPWEHPVTPRPLVPPISMAEALGWPAGERINTRGNRRTSGGNEFSADGPAWCLTEKARTWKRVSDGLRLTSGQAGLLTGFPADYPWQGSRSKQFLQAADVVAPMVAAAVMGATLGREILHADWRDLVRDYLAEIYPVGRATPGGYQGALFSLAV